MTPESYMKRYHGDYISDEADAIAIPAEELFPACPLAQEGDRPCDDKHPDKPKQCCCKASMVEALRLMCDPSLSALVDFDAFFFLTDSLTVGGSLTTPTSNPDNIRGLNASFRRFAPCNCDLIEVDGTAYFAQPCNTAVALETVDQISLCAVKAVAFGLADPDCPTDCEDSFFRRAVRAIRRAIRAEGGETSACATCQAHCDCDNCCCDKGILTELSTRNLSRLATLTVGPLVLQDVTVLGSIGSVLVLADEVQERFYFVCASQVETLG